MKPEWIRLDEIDVCERLRAVDQRHVGQLVASIKEIGLQTPITVVSRRDDDGDTSLILVAGAHRLEALRQLGAEGIDCFVLADGDAAELWEIDENFARSELTDAQRADHHARRKAILERRGLVRAHGGDRASQQFAGLKSYAAQAAETLGVHEETVRRDVRRAERISRDILTEVSGTSLDKGVVLDQLAATPKPEQRAKLAEITLQRTEAERARKETEGALRHTDRVIALTEAQQFAEWLLARSDLAELKSIISWLEVAKPKDVIAAIRREAA